MVSDTQARVYIQELDAQPWIHFVKDSPSVLSFGSLCYELGNSYSWPSGETPSFVNATWETSHGCSYQAEGSNIHGFSRQPRETLRKRSGERRAESVTTRYRRITRTNIHLPQLQQLGVIPRMKLSKNNLLMRNFPWLTPMRRGILWQNIPRVRKVSSVHSISERPHL